MHKLLALDPIIQIIYGSFLIALLIIRVRNNKLYNEFNVFLKKKHVRIFIWMTLITGGAFIILFNKLEILDSILFAFQITLAIMALYFYVFFVLYTIKK